MEIRQTHGVWWWAAFGVLLVGLWQTATVSVNFQGNWTALFCTGDLIPTPPSLAPDTYVFRESPGYDGQWYRYMAHDPLIQGDMHRYIDAPPLRYRRILLPALAALSAAGRQNRVDGAYIGVTLAFIYLGCYWCGVWSRRNRKHAAWGLLFLCVPATLISMDRMTVDVALAALAAGAVVYWDAGQLWRCYVCLACACLARETGTLIALGWVLGLALQKRWSTAAGFATAVVPAAAWFLYIRAALPSASRGQSVPGWLFHWDSGILGRILDPVTYGFPQPLEAIVRAADVFALAGMVLAFGFAASAAFHKRTHPPALAAALHLGLFAILNLKGFWNSVYGYARPFSSMIVLTALSIPMPSSLRVGLLIAVAAVDLRIFLQLGPQVIGMFNHLIQ